MTAPSLVDWGIAARVGGTIASPPGEDAPSATLPGDLVAVARDAEERVVAYTGMQPARPLPEPESVSRAAWLEGSLDSMRALLDPATAGAAGRMSGPLRAVGGTVLGAEVGALNGWLSRRVLGQYDLWLLDAEREPRLLLVGPNLRGAAGELGVELEPLTRWVAFHEVTHAVQFTAVPWLQDHLGGMLRELLAGLDVDVQLGDVLRLPSLDDLRGLVDHVRNGSLMRAVAGPERAALIDRVQATMAVVEGHAEHVMDAVGRDALPELDALRAALDRRRGSRSPLARALERLIGLDLKMRQYADGRRFCDAVVDRAGVPALHRVWDTPASLPDLAELADPDAWLRRTDAAAA